MPFMNGIHCHTQSPATLLLDDYFAAGTGAVWVIDPEARSVTVHEPGVAPVTVGNDNTLRGGSVLPAFACGVAELFEGLAPMK